MKRHKRDKWNYGDETDKCEFRQSDKRLRRADKTRNRHIFTRWFSVSRQTELKPNSRTHRDALNWADAREYRIETSGVETGRCCIWRGLQATIEAGQYHKPFQKNKSYSLNSSSLKSVCITITTNYHLLDHACGLIFTCTKIK